jgi:hypothetical protein
VFYDPVERIATRHADHTYEEIVFDPWQQATWDANGGVSDRGDCWTGTCHRTAVVESVIR